jgi:hypothetical protein
MANDRVAMTTYPLTEGMSIFKDSALFLWHLGKILAKSNIPLYFIVLFFEVARFIGIGRKKSAI